MDSNGAVQVPAAERSKTKVSANTLDLKQRFHSFALQAANASGTDGEILATKRMVDNGALLARANCDDFFVSAARLQRGTNLSRGSIAPILAVLTNIIALKVSDGDENAVKILSIASSAALAGISLVDQQFLFGAENIHEVRDLTFQALAAHKTAIDQLGGLKFEDGVQQLIDHQTICTPSSILGLTKKAIAAGKVTAEPFSAANQDQQALARLGSALGLIGPATVDQAAMVWKLYESGIGEGQIDVAFANQLGALGLGKLVDIPAAPVPTDGAPPAAPPPASLSATGKSVQGAVHEALMSFAPETKTKFSDAAKGRADPFGIELSPSEAGSKSIRLTVQ